VVLWLYRMFIVSLLSLVVRGKVVFSPSPPALSGESQSLHVLC
jgi:hypothetical protein